MSAAATWDEMKRLDGVVVYFKKNWNEETSMWSGLKLCNTRTNVDRVTQFGSGPWDGTSPGCSYMRMLCDRMGGIILKLFAQ